MFCVLEEFSKNNFILFFLKREKTDKEKLPQL